MGVLLYNCFLFFYRAGARLFSYRSPKARLWVNGRKDVFQYLEARLMPAGEGTKPSGPGMPPAEKDSRPLIWMHCASLGEFEQGRPLLEKIRLQYPACRILLTFFSPSGYEIRKNYAGADIICYLPMDSAAHARKLLDLVNPTLVLWVKYEYWYYYLTEIQSRKIPLLLISGIFREDQPFFKWYGGLHRKMLRCFSHFFVQTAASGKALGSLGLTGNVTVSGDTRFDRVTDIAEKFEPLPLIASFCEGHPVVVAGSTWPEDEEELDHYANTHPAIRFVVAPHETGEDHLRDIEELFTGSIRYSALVAGKERPDGVNVLIIDNIGMLSRIYKYATITYVGGGFGDSGLHNVLEAAVYGKPVIFGPVYDKFAEATELIEAGGGFSVDNTLKLEALLDELSENSELYARACLAAKEYVYAKRGATGMILDYIRKNSQPGHENRLLINL